MFCFSVASFAITSTSLEPARLLCSFLCQALVGLPKVSGGQAESCGWQWPSPTCSLLPPSSAPFPLRPLLPCLSEAQAPDAFHPQPPPAGGQPAQAESRLSPGSCSPWVSPPVESECLPQRPAGPEMVQAFSLPSVLLPECTLHLEAPPGSCPWLPTPPPPALPTLLPSPASHLPLGRGLALWITTPVWLMPGPHHPRPQFLFAAPAAFTVSCLHPLPPWRPQPAPTSALPEAVPPRTSLPGLTSQACPSSCPLMHTCPSTSFWL